MSTYHHDHSGHKDPSPKCDDCSSPPSKDHTGTMTTYRIPTIYNPEGTAMSAQLVRSPALAGAYGYVDSHGRIRSISVSRSDAVRNARLNGMPSIVHLRTTASGTVACSGPSPVIRWEDWRTGETF